MRVILNDITSGDLLNFNHPVEIIQTSTLDEVKECLTLIGEKSERDRLYAAGFISYEAAPAFDQAFSVFVAGELPLLCFGLFKEVDNVSPEEEANGDYSLEDWKPSISTGEYHRALKKIKRYIAMGDTYQVNYTFRLRNRFSGSPNQLYLDLIRGQRAAYSAFVETESHAVCSISPELFFSVENGILTMKPMKGTAPRGRTLLEDARLSRELRQSEKNRAENLMIVDMIRNDVGRIAEIGSVKVERLFEIETYPYLFQMTSTVVSKVNKSLYDILKALFPCGSITGAPKIRAMEIIREQESSPRGVYTGTVGCLFPDGRARFNVAIRTLSIHKPSGEVEFGVGGGIVWDSDTEDEYNECLTKAGILHSRSKPFKLFESMLWDPDEGYFLLKNHLERLRDSAEYFDFTFNLKTIKQGLEEARRSLPHRPAKIRLILEPAGHFYIESGPLTGVKSENLSVKLATTPVDSANPFLYHKTTSRDEYEKRRQEHPDVDDVLLWNEKGEMTESCRANIVVSIDGKMITPKISCGLLAGTYRRDLLERGEIEEGIVTVEKLKEAKTLMLINSVRKWMNARLLGG